MSLSPCMTVRWTSRLPTAVLVCAWLVSAAQPLMATQPLPTTQSTPLVPDPARDRPDQAAQAGEDPSQYVSFVLEDDSDCLLRDGKHVLVRNLHPTRTIRVWLDRYYRNTGTGDRSRSDLKPGDAGEPLGCSRIDNADQEWRIVRAMFLD